MKKNLLLLMAILPLFYYSQVGIGTPNPRGALDINRPQDNTMGLVLPRVTEANSTVTPTNEQAVEGTIVYDKSLKCIRIKIDTAWTDCLADISNVTNIVNNNVTINGNGAKIKAIAADAGYLYHSVYINAVDKHVYTMGYGTMGAVGTNAIYQRVPKKIIAEECIDVAAGYYSGYAVTKTGKLYSWGYNIYGKNGKPYPGTTTEQAPTQVIMPSGVKAVRVESSYFNTLILGSDNKLYAMGFNSNYVNGNGVNTGYQATPTLIAAGSMNGVTVLDFALDNDKVEVIDNQGRLHYWGNNINRANTSPTNIGFTNIPTLSTIFTGQSIDTLVKAIAVSSNSSIVITFDNIIHRFGNGNEIGAGAGVNNYNITGGPSLATGETISKIKGYNGGVGIGSYAIITKQANASIKPNVYIAGYNIYGKLGTATQTGYLNWTPINISALSVNEKIVDVAIGTNHSLFITGDDNGNGVLDTNDYNLFGAGYAYPGALGSDYQNNPIIPTQLKD